MEQELQQAKPMDWDQLLLKSEQLVQVRNDGFSFYRSVLGWTLNTHLWKFDTNILNRGSLD